jgi:hypothetical protein
LPVPFASTFDASPDAVFVASAGAAATSGGAGKPDGVGAGAGEAFCTAALAVDAVAVFVGALVAALPLSLFPHATSAMRPRPNHIFLVDMGGAFSTDEA